VIPTTQTILHDPANGQFGNCFAAMLASVLHLQIESIPSFYVADETDNALWMQRANAWLRQHGLAYVLVDASQRNILKDVGIIGCHHEVGGKTSRFSDVDHACVGMDGNLVFDPHPDRSGLTSITVYGLLVALRPWEVAALAQARTDLTRAAAYIGLDTELDSLEGEEADRIASVLRDLAGEPA
jgi:hypothetical protein